MIETFRYDFFCWECGEDWSVFDELSPSDLGCPSCEEFCQSMMLTHRTDEDKLDSYVLHNAHLFAGRLVWAEQVVAQNIDYSASVTFHRAVSFIPRFLIKSKPYTIVDPVSGKKYKIELGPAK